MQACDFQPQPQVLPPERGSCWSLLDHLVALQPAGNVLAGSPGAAWLDLPVMVDDSSCSAAPTEAVQEELQQLMALYGMQADAPRDGFVSLQAVAGSYTPPPPIARLRSQPVAQTEQATCIPPFLLRKARWPLDEKAAGSSALFRLELPVLPPAGSSPESPPSPVGAPTSAFSSLITLPDLPTGLPAPVFAPEGCRPLSMQELVAQDMILDDGVFTLPPVPMDADDAYQAESGD